jgi:hypothetical protein
MDGCSVKKSCTYMFRKLASVIKAQQPPQSLVSISARKIVLFTKIIIAIVNSIHRGCAFFVLLLL